MKKRYIVDHEEPHFVNNDGIDLTGIPYEPGGTSSDHDVFH